jgi:hypothetical protein
MADSISLVVSTLSHAAARTASGNPREQFPSSDDPAHIAP